MSAKIERCWAFVPARGGSKSIALKNLVELNGRPMLEYGIRAACASGRFDRIICSTDHPHITACAEACGIETDRRPDDLTGDDAKVDDVAREFLQRERDAGHVLPEIIVLVQPTSPFLCANHIHDLIDTFLASPQAASIHNVVHVNHNSHAWNQRALDADGKVQFLFREERSSARLKQQKPKLQIFGNLIAARTDELLAGSGFYAEPCAGLPIESSYGFDLDGPDDLLIAEAMIAAGLISLPHMNQGDK